MRTGTIVAAKPKTDPTQERYRPISDAFLLHRLGLTDDLNPFWEWKLSSKDEIPQEEIEEPEFTDAVKYAVSNGCQPDLIYSCSNYFRHAGSFRLANKKTIKSLIGRCDRAVETLGKHKKAIAIVSRALQIYPPEFQVATTDDRTVEFEDASLRELAEERAVIFAQILLRWCTDVAHAWKTPNPALLANGALPLSVYVDMIYREQNPPQRGAQSAVEDILKGLKPGPASSDFAATDDVDRTALRKNLLNFARRSPGVYSRLRWKLRALHQFATRP
jgi:hypothetical protein